MRIVDSAVLTALTQARSFIDSHLDQLGDLESAGYRRKLADAIAALEKHSVDQVTADRMNDAHMARQRALIAALRVNHMRPIAAIAAARLHDVPEFNAFRMPARHVRTSELVVAAESMAKMARKHAGVFVASGLAPDFVERLEAAADALRRCVTDRETTVTLKAAATAGLRMEASHGRKILRVLSALIEPRLENDEATLTAWRTSRHIRKPPTTQPVIFPLLGLALDQQHAADASSPSSGVTMRAVAAGAAQLALPPATAAAPFVDQLTPPFASAFSRAAQIIAGDADVERTMS